jgi:hypothetical protein
VREGLIAVLSVSATCGIEVSFVPQWYRAFQRADDCPERGLGGLGSCFGGFFPLLLPVLLACALGNVHKYVMGAHFLIE